MCFRVLLNAVVWKVGAILSMALSYVVLLFVFRVHRVSFCVGGSRAIATQLPQN